MFYTVFQTGLVLYLPDHVHVEVSTPFLSFLGQSLSSADHADRGVAGAAQ